MLGNVTVLTATSVQQQQVTLTGRLFWCTSFHINSETL